MPPPRRSPTIQIPPSLADNAVRTWGDQGRQWIEQLPALVAACFRRWELAAAPADFTLSFNFVMAVQRSDGTPAVLKLGVPTPDFLSEMAALSVYAGAGMCRVLESDAVLGAMLLERVMPGETLLALDERAAVLAAVSVMRELQRSLPHGVHLRRLVDQWRNASEGLPIKLGRPSPLPPDLVAEADDIYAEIRIRRSPEVVLHGDLHHWNILSSGDHGWLAIDPHGVLGPPECEVGAFMLNPNDGRLVRPDAREILSARLDLFAAELGHDRESMRRVALAYAVLSATWSAEDGSDRWRPAIDLARILQKC